MKKLLFLLIPLLLFSCASSNKQTPELQEKQYFVPESNPPKPDELTLLFAGDVMAHTQNFSMKNFDKIWKDIKDVVASADFAFANIEAPVCQTIPWSSYPSFNMHEEYFTSCRNAGFNVFSLANNHTNDHYLEGIQGTKEFTERTAKESRNTSRPVYFSGLKDSPDAPFSYCLIEKDGWKILYVAVTQLLNRPDCSSYINFVPSKKEEKAKFVKWLKHLKKTNPCDLFILSLHTNEEEYIRPVTKFQQNWYNQLLDSGIDILWANHTHLIKKQARIYSDKKSRFPDKLLMCANGNTISGQRSSPNFDMNFTERDDTGDGLLYKVTLRKMPSSGKKYIFKTERIFITTYINTANEYIIKKLDDDFISYLEENRPSWADYIKKRKEICESIED